MAIVKQKVLLRGLVSASCLAFFPAGGAALFSARDSKSANAIFQLFQAGRACLTKLGDWLPGNCPARGLLLQLGSTLALPEVIKRAPKKRYGLQVHEALRRRSIFDLAVDGRGRSSIPCILWKLISALAVLNFLDQILQLIRNWA